MKLEQILKNITISLRVDEDTLRIIREEEEIEKAKRIVNRLFEYSRIDEAGNVASMEIEND